MSEENRVIVRNYFEQVWNAHQLGRLEQFVAKNVVHHDAPGVTDYDSTKMAITMILKAFPDFKITIDDTITEGDRVVVRQTVSGTLQNELMGMPATGKHATWTSIGIFRIADGKIAELWGLSDQSSMMQQLGLMPEPAHA